MQRDEFTSQNNEVSELKSLFNIFLKNPLYITENNGIFTNYIIWIQLASALVAKSTMTLSM